MILLPGIFVFGSNLAGRHGKGAAAHARVHYGAETGVGRGRTGQAYALPTKDENLRTLPRHKVHEEIGLFVAYANDHLDLTFFLTPVGTGLAGHGRRDIWKAFADLGLPPNVALTSSWLDPGAVPGGPQ